MNIDLREELRKRDELLDGYLKQIEIQEEFIQKQKEAADAHKETIRVRNYWFQVLENMLLEFEKMQKKTKQELQEMDKRALKAKKPANKSQVLLSRFF